ncbi:MAG: ATP-binding protein [Lachnospiraceae bacterium]|nr:ATP-binding protein [Lachnospiraceae bacterium]
MKEEIKAKQLAAFRVRKEGSLSYRSMGMTEDEIAERRAYIRQALRNTPKNNLPNDILDKIRLTEMENKGYIFEDSEGREFYIRSGTLTQEETEFRKVRSMMPFNFIGLKGKDFNWDIYGKDIKKAKNYVNNFILKFEQFLERGIGLYIYSSTKGSGKTMLSCCILNEISDRYPISVKFINALDLLEMTKQGYKGDEPEELRPLYTSSVLVIDDIGVQMAKDWINTIFYRLINVRYTERLVTIYTSNIATDALKMDERIIDRIESTTYLVELPEVPVRHMKQEKEKERIFNEIENAP